MTRRFELLSPAEAAARFNTALDEAWPDGSPLDVELVPTAAARDRVLARDIASPIDVPAFRRSTVDGFAVRAADTPGALRVAGEVFMGTLSVLQLGAGEAARVSTGGHVPEGADAVLMVEHARESGRVGWIAAERAVAAGENVIQQGEDVRRGGTAVHAGVRLREPEIAGLLSLGMTQVDVRRQPRLAIIPSGDELVPPESDVLAGQIRQTNGAMLAAFARRNGAVPIEYDIVPDRLEAFRSVAQRAMHQADVIAFAAATSMGERDFVPEVVAEMGPPGIVVHGIAFRPGKPLLLAMCAGKPVFGLPGNPISALVTAELFLRPVLWRAQGALSPPPVAHVSAILEAEVRSPPDLEHWFPVALAAAADQGAAPFTARPITSKSNLIFSLVRADGLVRAPIGVGRLPAGSIVDVRLLS